VLNVTSAALCLLVNFQKQKTCNKELFCIHFED
ncbi:MAG: hypothetical protein ACI88A_003464, partial [Paraglaciecola sp.]